MKSQNKETIKSIYVFERREKRKFEFQGSIVLLPYVNVYFPMRRLLMLSAVSKASPTETEELEFVCGLVMR